MNFLSCFDRKEFSEALPGVELILGADGFSATREEMRIGDTLICYAGSQGQHIGVVGIEFGEEIETSHELVTLKQELPEDPEIKALVERAKEELAKLTGAQ